MMWCKQLLLLRLRDLCRSTCLPLLFSTTFYLRSLILHKTRACVLLFSNSSTFGLRLFGGFDFEEEEKLVYSPILDEPFD